MNLDVVLGPFGGFLGAQFQLDPLELFVGYGIELALAQGRVGEARDRALRRDDLDDFVAKRRPDGPAEFVVLGWDFHRPARRDPVVGLMDIGKDLEDAAAGLLVEHVKIGVRFGPDADQKGITLAVIAGRTVDVGPDQKGRLAVAGQVVDPAAGVPQGLLGCQVSTKGRHRDEDEQGDRAANLRYGPGRK